MTPMAKKRKLTTRTSPATLRQKKIKQQQEEEHQQQLLQQQQQQQILQMQQEKQLQLVKEKSLPQEGEEEEDLEYEEEVEEEEEEDEEEEEEAAEDDEGEQAKPGNNRLVFGDDDEPIQKLLELFSKEQLSNILTQVAESHNDVAARIRRIADEDPVHRKIFVHGLGWDTTADTLRNAFSQYGEIEDCKAVTDKISGKSKGYGFILFKSRSGASKALKQPQKKIGNRMTACQLAAVGPVPANAGAAAAPSGPVIQQPQSEYTQRKIYVSNVSADIDPTKLANFFAKFGEIEEGPLGLDKQTGKPKGFCLFMYKTVDGARRALEDPHKNFEGHMLHCQKAIDGPKPGKQQQIQQRNAQFGRNDHLNFVGNIGAPSVTGAAHLMGQSVGAVPFNQGAAVAAQAALNPALGQALTALLASQGAGLGLTNLLGTIGTAGVGAAVNPAVPGAYGNQPVGASGVLGGYAGQGLQAAYPNQQLGQGSVGRSQHGHMGGVAPYSGH